MVRHMPQHMGCLFRLDGLERCKFGPKDFVPESACDAEPILVICEMVLQVIFLEGTIVRRKAVKNTSN